MDKIHVKVNIVSNPYNIPQERLFRMAARINPKRSFLFVSNILGKHIPVPPYIPLIGGIALASRYLEEVYDIYTYQREDIINVLKTWENGKEIYKKFKKNPFELPEKTLFIGFAETAIALGHSVFNSFRGDGYYIHSTREIIEDFEEIITFEEEHSHATSHKIYLKNFPIFNSNCPIVFIDDEITTGKTILNIIESIHKNYPRKNYNVITILDWRSEKDKKRFKDLEEKLDIEIRVISIISGHIEVEGESIKSRCGLENNNRKNNINEDIHVQYLYLDSFFKDIYEFDMKKYLKWTGRFGISLKLQYEIDKYLERAGLFLKGIRKGKRTLCMGTEEFMYIPMILSSYIGENVYYQSTTRSPIYSYNKEEYGARNAFSFKSPNDQEITNYFYNVPYKFYDELFLFLERKVERKKLDSILNRLKTLGIKNIYVVMCT